MAVRSSELFDLEAPNMLHEPVKKLSKKACLKCNELGGVLMCSNGGCPIVLHEDCMSCVACFDAEGNFYCPYCAYKRSVDECHQAKERVISAKKALASFLDAKAVGSTRDSQVVRSSKRKKPEGSDFTSQEDISENRLLVKLDFPKKPDDIGELYHGEVGEGTIYVKSLNDDLHHVMDNVIRMKQTSENLKSKRQKTAVALKGYSNQGIQRNQTEREPHQSTIRSTINDVMKNDGGSDKINAPTLQNEYAISEQFKVSLEHGDQSAEIQKYQSDHAKNVKESGLDSGKHEGTEDTDVVNYEEIPEKENQQVEASTYSARNDDLTVTDQSAGIQKYQRDDAKIVKESGLDSGKHEANVEKEVLYYEEMPEKEHEQVEASINSTRNDDLTVTKKASARSDINVFHVAVSTEGAGFEGHLCGRTDEEQLVVKSVSDDEFHLKKFALASLDSINPAFEDDNVIVSQMALNLENAYEQAGTRDPYGSANEKQTLCKQTINAEIVNMATENQQNTENAMEGNMDGVAKKVHNQLKPGEPTQDNAEVVNEGAGEGNNSLHEDENLITNQMVVNKNNADQTCDVRDFHCRRVDEGMERVKLQKNDVIFRSKESPGELYGDTDFQDGSKLSQECRHKMNASQSSKWKSQISAHSDIDNLPRESSGSSESEREDCEDKTYVKSRVKSIKPVQHQHTPITIGRRKKLPWTVEEEEMLKEGVDKFSLTGNKNMPWMKILEFGSHVFDGTRTPDDLKDKWKRILSKAHVNAD